MKIENVSDSYIISNYGGGVNTKEYYYYCVNLIKNFLCDTESKYNIFLSTHAHDLNNSNKSISIDIQFEHTLVRNGGRGVHHIIHGTSKYDDNECYLVRIDRYEYLKNLDFIIEYSLSNYFNILNSGFFDEFCKKLICIHPMIYNINFDRKTKKDVITLYTLENHERRARIHNQILDLNINYKNIDNIFSGEEIIELYKNSKILVNIHQTEHHHTFEELRTLPALLNGVIVISERSGLTDCIPYGKYIIWCEYHEIKDKVKEVYENYDYYYNKIFSDESLLQILKNMEIHNNNILKNFIK